MSLVLMNGTMLGLSPRGLEQGNIGISSGRIDWVGNSQPSVDDDVVDCSGRLVMPGNVCAHTHLYSALARGMPAPKAVPRNFPQILENIWWRLDRALDEPGIRISALVGALDAVRCGTTTLIDHHASPNSIDGSLDSIADALQEVGVRGVVCYEVTDRGGRDRREAALRENERFLGQNRRETIAGVVGAHASFTLEDETLAQLAELADQFTTGIHIHVAEDLSDEEDSLRRCSKRAAERLSEAGIFRPKSIGAHGVHLDRVELDAIKETDAWLVHNCRSNMNNGVGRAPIQDFGTHAALGTDGIDEDMFAESRTAYFRARENSSDHYAEEFTEFLARGGELASQYFSTPVGALDPGSAADLVILNYDPPTPLTTENIAWHWMFALDSRHVTSVLVNGQWVLRDGEFRAIDEEKVRAEAREEAARLWERMEAL